MGTLEDRKIEVLNELSRLEKPQRIAYGAACSDRMLPAYLAYIKDEGKETPIEMIRALDKAWQLIGKGDIGPCESLDASCCDDAIPDLDHVFSPIKGLALCASSAIKYLLLYIQDSKFSNIVYIHDQLVDAADDLIFCRSHELHEPVPPDELILMHPIMKNELHFEASVISILKDCHSIDCNVVAKIKILTSTNNSFSII